MPTTKETKIRNEDRGVPMRVKWYRADNISNQSTSSGTWSDVTGVNANYSAGPQDETVLVTINILHVHDGAGGGYIRPKFNGVSETQGWYSNNSSAWNQSSRTYLVDVDANKSLNVKLEWYASASGGPTQISFGVDHRPHIFFEAYPRQS